MPAHHLGVLDSLAALFAAIADPRAAEGTAAVLAETRAGIG
ncbi:MULTISPECIES: hypothetical protein [unclassified Kitasatospora]|nr:MULTISPECIES: hypothetical protein [unclassified Kitasatospora]